jgi:hypothetical protein
MAGFIAHVVSLLHGSGLFYCWRSQN